MIIFWTDELQQSPIGPIGLAASEERVVRISLFGRAGLERTQDYANHPAQVSFADSPPPQFLGEAVRQIEEYLLGKRRVFDFPLDLQGYTPLAGQVLAACQAIPFGAMKTYRQLAVELGRPGMARFVGNMMARNPLPLVIPCHRVVGSDRLLHGFGAPGGLATKAWLLTMEGQKLAGLKVR